MKFEEYSYERWSTRLTLKTKGWRQQPSRWSFRIESLEFILYMRTDTYSYYWISNFDQLNEAETRSGKDSKPPSNTEPVATKDTGQLKERTHDDLSDSHDPTRNYAWNLILELVRQGNPRRRYTGRQDYLRTIKENTHNHKNLHNLSCASARSRIWTKNYNYIPLQPRLRYDT
jgi:hypothetical protein